MDMVLTFALWWAPVLAIAVFLSAIGAVKLRTAWLGIALILYAVYFTTISFGGQLIPVEKFFGELDWNWSGKIASVLATFVLFCVLAVTTKSITPASAGFVLRQRSGSVTPALIALALLVMSVVALEILAADGSDTGAERLLFQLTMPGLDEELFFRGVLLAALAAAIPIGGVNILGAKITLAGLLMTLLFGFGHGAFVQDQQLVISWPAVIVTAYLGFGLLWIRERTGSILIPILSHNLINFTGSFF